MSNPFFPVRLVQGRKTGQGETAVERKSKYANDRMLEVFTVYTGKLYHKVAKIVMYATF